jgi:hypothetical protein
VLYQPSLKGPLQQGELIRGLWEHRPDVPPVQLAEGAEFPVTSLRHDLMIVMSPGCDLEWDFLLRFPTPEHAAKYEPVQGIEGEGKHIPHVLLCDAYPDEDLLNLAGMNKGLWKTITSNQDARYHRLPSASVGSTEVTPLPQLVLDFKKPLTFPTAMVYEGFLNARVLRLGVVPPVYVHDLIQRFYGFLSRVALPD